MRENGLRLIFDKTSGHCHFCGDPIKFQNRGWCEKPNGHWEVDHVIQRDKGGTKLAENCLPACMRCNRLRWHRTGDSIRDILLLGIIARKEIKNSSRVGRELLRLRAERLIENEARRRRGLVPRS
jgi:5-methylcytosine-specific restriction endonuclease McrA